MRSKPLKGFFLILAVSFLTHTAFAADPAFPRIENSLPQEKLARYDDAFNEIREDIWEKSDGDNGFFLAQMENFKLADTRIQEGRLVFETKTGGFSSANIGSKFAFKGDFDVQVDCHVDFLKDAYNMDQITIFSVVDATPGFKEGELEFVNFGVSKQRDKPAVLYSNALMKEVFKLSKWKRIDRFMGSFRLIKVGSSLHALYRNEGEAAWISFDTLHFDKNVAAISIGARNSTVSLLSSLGAKSPFTARFDNFRVNAAQEIIAPEIFPASALELASLRIQNSLPQEKLARYNDSFNEFREDIWEKGGGFFLAQMENFKLADTRIQDGRLVIETKTGGFSDGGVGSKFTFKGDFDVQVDCHVDFLKGADDMDQIVNLSALDPTQGLKDEELVAVHVGVAKERGKPAGLYSLYFMKGVYKANRAKRIDRFRGSLRLVRFGPTLYAFYRNEGASTWKSFGAFPFDRRATGIGLGVRNFEMRKAASIGAKSPFIASFDNFRVNAAQEIVESEI